VVTKSSKSKKSKSPQEENNQLTLNVNTTEEVLDQGGLNFFLE